jgi:tetratricopeptide (TPR) repeat protein
VNKKTLNKTNESQLSFFDDWRNLSRFYASEINESVERSGAIGAAAELLTILLNNEHLYKQALVYGKSLQDGSRSISDRLVSWQNLPKQEQIIRIEQDIRSNQENVSFWVFFVRLDIANLVFELLEKRIDESNDSFGAPYKKAFKVMSEMVAMHYVSKEQIVRAHGYMGDAYSKLNSFHQALPFYMHAYKFADSNGDQLNACISLGNIGYTLVHMNNPQEAIIYFESALDLARDREFQLHEAASLCGLGNAYFEVGNYSEAANCYQRQLVVARKMGDKETEAMALRNLGLTYTKMGQDPSRL